LFKEHFGKPLQVLFPLWLLIKGVNVEACKNVRLNLDYTIHANKIVLKWCIFSKIRGGFSKLCRRQSFENPPFMEKIPKVALFPNSNSG